MNNYKYVGKKFIRQDSFDRVTGVTKFTADIKRHMLLYGKLVLSEKAHADISFDFDEALLVPGIYTILTYKDIPHIPYNCMEWFTGISAYHDEYILHDRARFVGDRIALVLGENKHAVEEAIKKIIVHYKELPVITNLDDAQKDTVIIKRDSNLAYEKKIGCGDFKKALDEADYIIEDSGSTPRTHHLAIEPHAALAEFDTFGNLVIHSPGQIVFAIQMHMARILQIPYSKIRVIKTNMGGSFGGKQQPLLELIAGAVAWIIKRPVLVYMDREQSIIGTFTRNPTKVKITTAIKKDGTILGRKVETLVDGGAYDTNNTSIINAYAKKLFRLYKIYNQEFHGKAFYTNGIPGGACRAYGGPQSHAVSEINITNAAKKIGMDPCEFRLKNLVDPYDDDPVGGPNLGKAGIKDCIKAGMKVFNWKEKYEHIHKKNTDRYAYGVGVACATHGNGYLGVFPDFTNVEMILNPDGTLFVKIAVHEQGCGTIDSLCLIAAEAIDMNPANITITEADTAISPYDSAGTQASRVTFVAGGALIEAGTLLKQKIFNTLHTIEHIPLEDMYSDCGTVKIKNSDKTYTYAEIATMAEKSLSNPTSVYIHHVPKSNPAAFAACFAEVKVDKKTGLVEITDLLAVHDIGKAINPLLVEGQIHGGCQFILGMALSEEIIREPNGSIKNKTLSKYHVLNAQDMPAVKVMLIETEDETAPYGLKSVGEIAAVAPAPAVLNAINHALGTNICDYPATPERIIESIEKLPN
ncbi:xanthine dehydrogenase family protein molybdopterin-binding subunit [Treponema phagedenis]|uniref:Aldehyde oxidase and xanthine dehydrogenase, molybdopterin binding domain protein n=1 Tax=Treponema phagedenis TaxID=162 RepID=A0A0B7GYI2_TREPH|nr:molybdopterin cofactor-binding domain-containing protein [Treponema phagedenis]EFW37191.1 aldehyde oxidase and xanthine dehydrogenase, molybdopterin binding domain protein [Treponema phagedenis F0421]QEJ94800.1 molybdopterin-dependent oxidoreductase [Treponema phagedenis]QEJ97981.1 molybdopterin-dependent oxidoreductase [Treponema phagedenis]QEK00704.1 molybdopterin-dependent oxidoreductase [Treponema phagedenis]QEK03488.1 molybdopterin-dependent oxidoreductase [Treponema phagedenis]